MDTTNTGVVDLSAMMPVESATLEIRAPGGTKGTGWIWTLAGVSHPKAVAHQNERTRQALRRTAQVEQQQANGKKVKVDEKTPEELLRENAEWVASRTLGFTPIRIASIQEADITWSDARVVELMMRPDMGWVFVQLTDYLNADRAFTPGSATS